MFTFSIILIIAMGLCWKSVGYQLESVNVAEDSGRIRREGAPESPGPFNTSTVRLVQLLFRHGDRTPIAVYPEDPTQHWPEGWGSLTKLGAKQAFDLGRYLKERYLELNLSGLDKDKVYARCTYITRTLETARCVLSGIQKQKFDNSCMTQEQAIPVHQGTEAEDQLLSMAPCPLAGHLSAVWKTTSTIWKSFVEKYSALFKYLTEKTGMTVNESNVNRISDDLYVEEHHNLTQRDWMTRDYQEQLMTVFDYCTRFRCPTPEMQRLAAGPLVEQMFMNIQKHHLNTSGVQLYLYSAHDTNVVAFLTTLGVFNNRQPPYTACVMMELHEIDAKFYVRVLYRNGSNSADLHQLQIPGCDVMCSVARIQQLLKNVTLNAEDRAVVCGPLPKLQSKEQNNLIPIVVGGVIIFGAIVVFAVYVIHQRRKKLRSNRLVDYRQLLQSSEANLGDSDDDDELL